MINRMRDVRGDNLTIIPKAVKRPIDKQLIFVSQAVATAQDSTILYTATFPCTMTGLRWDVSALGNVTAATTIVWLIVIVRDGLTIPTLSTTDAATIFHPEQDVLSFGVGLVADLDAGVGNIQQHWTGDTKTMRKLQGGDRLIFLSICTSNTGVLAAGVQFFLKG